MSDIKISDSCMSNDKISDSSISNTIISDSCISSINISDNCKSNISNREHYYRDCKRKYRARKKQEKGPKKKIPKTAAERQREYRARKKLKQGPKVKIPKTATERNRAYRLRKKLKFLLGGDDSEQKSEISCCLKEQSELKLKSPKTAAERQRECRLRKKLERQLDIQRQLEEYCAKRDYSLQMQHDNSKNIKTAAERQRECRLRKKLQSQLDRDYAEREPFECLQVSVDPAVCTFVQYQDEEPPFETITSDIIPVNPVANSEPDLNSHIPDTNGCKLSNSSSDVCTSPNVGYLGSSIVPVVKSEPVSDADTPVTNGSELSDSSRDDVCASSNVGNLEIVIKRIWKKNLT